LQALAERGELTPALVLKDPYVLEFIELNDHFLEKDLEDAILRELEQFLLELGAGFTIFCPTRNWPKGLLGWYLI
jgi:predicted nuclease of restriction endonuclease-like (RecB) superfamily